MHLTIINGSPRVKKYSNSEKIIDSFCKGLSKDITYEKYAISSKKLWNQIKESFDNNKDILIVIPVYVECIPGLLLEFLETLTPKNDGTKIYYILQSGFSEGCQLRCAEKYLEKLTPMLGCEYGGCLVKGNNFGIRFSEGKMLDNTLNPYQEMGRVFADKKDFFSDEAKEFTGAEYFSKIECIIVSIFAKTFSRMMFKKMSKQYFNCKVPLDDKPLLK